jgi:hypothetical protein
VNGCGSSFAPDPSVMVNLLPASSGPGFTAP